MAALHNASYPFQHLPHLPSTSHQQLYPMPPPLFNRQRPCGLVPLLRPLVRRRTQQAAELAHVPRPGTCAPAPRPEAGAGGVCECAGRAQRQGAAAPATRRSGVHAGVGVWGRGNDMPCLPLGACCLRMPSGESRPPQAPATVLATSQLPHPAAHDPTATGAQALRVHDHFHRIFLQSTPSFSPACSCTVLTANLTLPPTAPALCFSHPACFWQYTCCKRSLPSFLHNALNTSFSPCCSGAACA